MPSEHPNIAACPQCGTILVWTPRVLVHPLSEERGAIRRALGAYWSHHAAHKVRRPVPPLPRP